MSLGSAQWVLLRMRGFGLSFEDKSRWLGRACVCLAALLMHAQPASGESQCARIVSLAPSVTEVLFDLGLGSQMVGATKFCRYPPEATRVPRVGGYLDLNVERVVTLRPTAVFGLAESAVTLRPLERFSIPVDLLNHGSVKGIKESYRQVAGRCGVAELAQARLAALAEREKAVKDRCAVLRESGSKLRVMVVVGRTREGSADSGVYVSGSDGFYSDVISLLGAVSVHQGNTVAVPTLSVEGILGLAPDAIVDVVNVDDGWQEDRAREFWSNFPKVPAVKQGRVEVITGDFASIPGPRYIVLAEYLAQKLCV